MTLQQFLAKKTTKGKRHAKKILELGQVTLNGKTHFQGDTLVGKFDHVAIGEEVLSALIPRYLFMNKPAGILSATADPIHKTVIDLISEPWASELHIAGRLDRATTGLVILTNDSELSKRLTHPNFKTPKTYRVNIDQVIRSEVIHSFEQGMYFAKEDIHTHPAKVERLDSHSCRLTIFEGKHHQIKRMFLRFGCRVTQLHRESIGSYNLPEDLHAGNYRYFIPDEMKLV